MSIDYKDVYEGRIVEIKKQLRQAVMNKKWTEKAKLEAEKADLELKISKMEG